MNPRFCAESSLVDFIQAQAPHSLHLLSETTANHWLRSICEGLIQHQIVSRLWVKVAPDSPFCEPIAVYGQSGLLQRVYWCGSTERDVEPAEVNWGSETIIEPILLADNSQIQEDFWCFLSTDISLLWIVQRSEKMGIVKVIQSLCPTAIAAFLAAVKQRVTMTDDLPPDFFQPEPLPGSANLTLVSQLIQGIPSPMVALATPPPKAVSSPSQSATFLLNATRELGIPLTNMKTALRLLESMQHKREQRQRYLDLLKQECNRQNSLLTGLQELLQIDQAPPVGDVQGSVHIEDCVPGVVSTYQPIAEEKGIALGYTIPGDYPTIACSAPDLRTILQHLLHNSLKFTPQGGKVYVKAHRQEQSIDLVVSDTGCGIEMPDIPHLFDCFYRGRNASAADQGAGLGLTIVQRLVKRWGGTIKVSSHPGRGSYFYVSLPIEASNSPQ